jgi:poly(A) polymerase Pap1
LIIINKYDLVNDVEIIQEYKKQVLKQFNIFIKQNKWKNLTKKVFDQNTFVISAATHL